MKKGWEKRFDEMWFAPKGETTIMDWTGLINNTEIRGFFGLGSVLFGYSAYENERVLKEELANLIKSFIKSELK